MEISGKAICKYEKYEKREDDQHEFVRACDELKTELKKTRMYRLVGRENIRINKLVPLALYHSNQST